MAAELFVELQERMQSQTTTGVMRPRTMPLWDGKDPVCMRAAAATGLEVAACMTFDTAARSMMGVTPVDFGASFVGANCGIGPAELLHSVREMLPAVETPVIAKGNCGIPAYVDGSIHYHGTPELMADYACFARDAGIGLIGGCCGLQFA